MPSIDIARSQAASPRRIFDSKTKRVRLADPDTGALPELATAETLLPILNRVFVALGGDPLPDDTTDENLLRLLEEKAAALEGARPMRDRLRLSDELAVNALRRACGLEAVGGLLAPAIEEAVRIVETVPLVRQRGRQITMQDKLRRSH